MRIHSVFEFGITTLLTLAISLVVTSVAFADSHEGVADYGKAKAAEAKGMGDAMKASGEETAEAAKDKAMSEQDRAAKKAEKEQDRAAKKAEKKQGKAAKKLDEMTTPEASVEE